MSLKSFSTFTQNSSENNFPNNLNNFPLHVVKSKIRTFHHYLMNRYEKAHISSVIELFKLILVLPATNASSERSFSLLRLVKSYLRATTGQGRLIHLMILNAYKENADKLNLKDVAREFIHKSDTRISLFGKI